MSPREASPRIRVGYTPNFDGVLNNGESWVARRRSSEASMKAGNGLGREPFDNQQSSRSSSILEEKEDGSISMSQHSGEDSPFFATSSPQAQSVEPRQNSEVVSSMDSVTSTDGFAPDGSIPFEADVGPPPGLIDLAAVEWSYKDPTGQVQGAFPRFQILTLFYAF